MHRDSDEWKVYTEMVSIVFSVSICEKRVRPSPRWCVMVCVPKRWAAVCLVVVWVRVCVARLAIYKILAAAHTPHTFFSFIVPFLLILVIFLHDTLIECIVLSMMYERHCLRPATSACIHLCSCVYIIIFYGIVSFVFVAFGVDRMFVESNDSPVCVSVCLNKFLWLWISKRALNVYFIGYGYIQHSLPVWECGGGRHRIIKCNQ